MGQAKDKKKRLGEWYGRPIKPGHPDYQAPKKQEPASAVEIVDRTPGENAGRIVAVVGGPENTTAPTVPSEEKLTEPENPPTVIDGDTTRKRRPARPGLMFVALALSLTAGLALPEPEPRKKF